MNDYPFGSPQSHRPLLSKSSRLSVILAVITLTAGSVHAQTNLDSWMEPVVQAAVEAVAPSVVQIKTIGGLDRVEGVNIAEGPTSGLIVGSQGLIITSSFNLIQQPAGILVELDSGERLPAELVARDESRQLVLLKVSSGRPLAVPHAVPRERLRVGQSVIAVGKVYDAVTPNVSTGILSAKSRVFGKAIQCDAKISPANFGGPLIDIDGNVLGILVPMSPDGKETKGSADWYDSGIGFAVPLVDVLSRLEELAAGRDLRAGVLGVSLKQELGHRAEAIVAACDGDSPAGRAGIRAGDKIVQLNGRPITSRRQLQLELGPLYEGDSVELVVERDQRRLETVIRLAGAIMGYRHAFLGVLPIDGGESGVRVRGVVTDGPAHRAGIAAGDVIAKVDSTSITDQASLAALLLERDIGDSLTISLLRDGEQTEANLTLAAVDANPMSVPPSHEPERRPDAGAGFQELRLPEFASRAWVYAPPEVSSAVGSSLLTWVSPPGPIDRDQWLATWKPFCDAYHVIVVLPESAEDNAWDAAEAEFILRITEQLQRSQGVNRRRVAIAGVESGGVMASLVAFQDRSVFRGVALVNSLISNRITDAKSDAVNRLLVLLVDEPGGRTQDWQTVSEQLSDGGFPVWRMSIDESSEWPLPRVLVHWVATLDRM